MNIFAFTQAFVAIGLCLFCAACGTIAKPVYADTVDAIEIQILQQPSTAGVSVEVNSSRSGAGSCIVTYQSDYWEKGDLTETQKPHFITVQFDNQKPITLDGQYIFWNNASIQDVYDESDQHIGSYLLAPMHICFGSFIQNLDLGNHKGRLEITSTSGMIHRYGWAFKIEKLMQTSLSPTLKPTATYLENNPQATPEFVRRLTTVASDVNRFDCPYFPLNESLKLEFDKTSFGSTQFLADNLSVEIDGNQIPKNNLCVGDTDYNNLRLNIDTSELTAGLHIASMNIKTNSGEDKLISWTFRVELPKRK
ncbi:MAG: hypothetical protein GC179_11565 [Anaerolineaceae bacterium]|nr:hypothetical protein [Anaerolineaceae bacterium]